LLLLWTSKRILSGLSKSLISILIQFFGV